MLLRRAGLTASAGLSCCYTVMHDSVLHGKSQSELYTLQSSKVHHEKSPN